MKTQALEFENDIQQCVHTLQEGGIILYPTDTIWGIGCDATNKAAVEKIYRLKKREESKSLIVLVAEEKDILQYVAAPDLLLFDYLENREQPVTVIYDGVIGLADIVLAEDGSAGIRMAKDLFCRALIKRFGKPIVSTSANISGSPTPANYSQISDGVKSKMDYIVQYRQGETDTAMASTIIRWQHGAPVIIRP
jgi:L-threonylcarbamoyladenylate synthase